MRWHGVVDVDSGRALGEGAGQGSLDLEGSGFLTREDAVLDGLVDECDNFFFKAETDFGFGWMNVDVDQTRRKLQTKTKTTMFARKTEMAFF